MLFYLKMAGNKHIIRLLALLLLFKGGLGQCNFGFKPSQGIVRKMLQPQRENYQNSPNQLEKKQTNNCNQQFHSSFTLQNPKFLTNHQLMNQQDKKHSLSSLNSINNPQKNQEIPSNTGFFSKLSQNQRPEQEQSPIQTTPAQTSEVTKTQTVSLPIPITLVSSMLPTSSPANLRQTSQPLTLTNFVSPQSFGAQMNQQAQNFLQKSMSTLQQLPISYDKPVISQVAQTSPTVEESVPVQTSPTTELFTPIQNYPSAPFWPTQPNGVINSQNQPPLIYFIMAPPPNSMVPYTGGYPNVYPALYPNEEQSKSQKTLKTMLPLILNLLKERNTKCPFCNNCGFHNTDTDPLVLSGYANKSFYGQNQDIKSENDQNEEESGKPEEKEKKNKKSKNDSNETDYYDTNESEEHDSYEN